MGDICVSRGTCCTLTSFFILLLQATQNFICREKSERKLFTVGNLSLFKPIR